MRSDMEAGVVVIGMGSLGVILAFIVGLMNTRGIIFDELITGSITISDLQIAIIILFLLCGMIMGALKR